MEKFNITRQTKRDLAKLVKEAIGTNDYTELSIVYLAPSHVNNGRFGICGTTEKDLIDSNDRGECFYKSFSNYKADGKITLKRIEEDIFN